MALHTISDHQVNNKPLYIVFSVWLTSIKLELTSFPCTQNQQKKYLTQIRQTAHE